MEALYGGQAGGGKSEALLALALQYVHVPGYAAIIFRRTLTDLKQPGSLLDRAHSWLRGKPGCRFAGDEHTYHFDTRWPDGTPGHPSKIAFGYIGEANIQTRYQSAEYQRILWDELTQHEESNYLYLFSRLRKKSCPVHKSDASGVPIYKDDCMYCHYYKSLPVDVRSATNPGGIGHQWVRDRFGIVPSEHIPLYEIKEDDTTINWIGTQPDRPFIQASYRDNPHIDQASYSKALDNLSSIERARLKYGNWAVNVDARFKPRWARHYSTRGDRYFTLGRDGHGPVVDMSQGIQRIFTTVDPAASKREGMAEAAGGRNTISSWTVIATWALTNDFHLMLLDVVRFQDEIPVVVKELVAVNKRWRPAYFRIEGNGLGKGVVQYAQIYGLTVKEGKRYTDKVVNSTAAQLRMEQGRIWFPQQAPWLKTWEDEIFNWTGDDSQTDDQVDVLADAAQDVVWEAGDDRVDRDDHLPTSHDYPMCFGYNEINPYF
jgi:predicted phage terminase large subunit-like protein